MVFPLPCVHEARVWGISELMMYSDDSCSTLVCLVGMGAVVGFTEHGSLTVLAHNAYTAP